MGQAPLTSVGHVTFSLDQILEGGTCTRIWTSPAVWSELERDYRKIRSGWSLRHRLRTCWARHVFSQQFPERIWEKELVKSKASFLFHFYAVSVGLPTLFSSCSRFPGPCSVYKSLGSGPLPTTVNCPRNTKKTEGLRTGAIFHSLFSQHYKF